MARDDYELLDAWRAGDRGAGSALFDRYFESLYCFFRNKVDDASAEDLVQQTLLACVKVKDGLRKEASFRTYLFRAAKSRLYNFYDARHRRNKAIDPSVSSCAELGVLPSFAATTREHHRLLLDALRHIPLDLQIVLELYYFERMHAPQLAEVLELPEGTVRTRLRRALELMRQRLSALLGGDAKADTTMSNLDDWAEQIRGSVLKREPEA